MSATSLGRAFSSLEVSPIEVVEACLERISHLDKHLNCYISVTADLAISEARHAEREISKGRWRGMMHGVPVALKDIIATKGVRTTCGSRILTDWIPNEDAAVVQKLRDAGAILIGKLNMSEFAYISIHPDHGPVRNPWNPRYFTGGSSSGSAAALAATLCFGSIGTDTGGSIRSPAAFCGIVGMKPTYGLISRCGVVPLSPSLDHVGPMARTVEDLSVLLDAVRGHDGENAGSAPAGDDFLTASFAIAKHLRAAVIIDIPSKSSDPEVLNVFMRSVQVIGEFVKDVDRVAMPHADLIRFVWSTICMVEASAFHQRFFPLHAEEYSAGLRRLLEAGFEVPAVDYFRARQLLTPLIRGYEKIFQEFDIVILPTKLCNPPTLESATDWSWAQVLDQLITTAPFNLIGYPAISVPCGFTSAGLPVGLQIVGPPFKDHLVLAVARAYEQATESSKRSPPVEAFCQLPPAET